MIIITFHCHYIRLKKVCVWAGERGGGGVGVEGWCLWGWGL